MRSWLCGHVPAAFGAPAARIDAFLHVPDLFAVPGTFLAHFGADRAGAFVKLAAHQHEIRRSLADLGTGHHEPEMARFDMLTAFFQAVAHGHAEAGAMAAQAFIDAILHVLRDMVHVDSPFRKRRIDQRRAGAGSHRHRRRQQKAFSVISSERTPPSKLMRRRPPSGRAFGACRSGIRYDETDVEDGADLRDHALPAKRQM